MSLFIGGANGITNPVLYEYQTNIDGTITSEVKLPESRDYFINLFAGYRFIMAVVSCDYAPNLAGKDTGTGVIDVARLTSTDATVRKWYKAQVHFRGDASSDVSFYGPDFATAAQRNTVSISPYGFYEPKSGNQNGTWNFTFLAII